MTHSFDVTVAKTYGVEKAVLIHNLAFWIRHNKANKTNYHDGYFWTYNSAKAFTELFPYFNRKKISRMLLELEEKEVIKSGNYNKKGYDRTKWYTITDLDIILIYELDDKPLKNNISQKCPMEWSEMTNAMVKSDQPIPYINQIKNADVLGQQNDDEIVTDKFKQVFEKNTRSNPTDEKEKKVDYKDTTIYLNDIKNIVGNIDVSVNAIKDTGKKKERIKEVVEFAKKNDKNGAWIVWALREDKELIDPKPKTQIITETIMNDNFEWVTVKREVPIHYNGR